MGVKEDWAGLDRILCKRIHAPVVIYDNRGIGESGVPTSGYTIEQLALDMFTVATAALGNRQFDVLGISMGGCIAQMAALMPNSSLIRRLVLGCSTPGGAQAKLGPGLLACFNLMSDPASKTLSPRELTINIQHNNLPEPWVYEYPNMFEQFISDLLRYHRPLEGLLGQMQALSKFNLSRRVSSIRIPTFIVHGDEDAMVPLESGKMLHQLIPESQMIEIKGAAHLFWITHLHDTVRPVAAFLRSPNPRQDNSPHLMASTTSSAAVPRAKL